jgi:hypothetical protein
MAGCSMSLYKDYKAGDKLVCRNVKYIKKALKSKISGICATIFCVLFSVTFALIWLIV